MKTGKQALMNNKDKAMEIAECCTCNDPFCCVRFSEGQENSGCNRFCDALEMAKWKEGQIFGMLKKLGYELALTAVKQLMSAKRMEE